MQNNQMPFQQLSKYYLPTNPRSVKIVNDVLLVTIPSANFSCWLLTINNL